MSRVVSARLACCFWGVFLVVGSFVPRMSAQAAVQGKWSTLNYTMTINPIHVALMHNGKILVVTVLGTVRLRNQVVQRGHPTGARIIPAQSSWIRLPRASLSYRSGMTCSATV